MKKIILFIPLVFILIGCDEPQPDDPIWAVEVTFHNGDKDTISMQCEREPYLRGYKTNGDLAACWETYATGVRSFKVLSISKKATKGH